MTFILYYYVFLDQPQTSPASEKPSKAPQGLTRTPVGHLAVGGRNKKRSDLEALLDSDGDDDCVVVSATKPPVVTTAVTTSGSTSYCTRSNSQVPKSTSSEPPVTTSKSISSTTPARKREKKKLVTATTVVPNSTMVTVAPTITETSSTASKQAVANTSTTVATTTTATTKISKSVGKVFGRSEPSFGSKPRRKKVRSFRSPSPESPKAPIPSPFTSPIRPAKSYTDNVARGSPSPPVIKDWLQSPPPVITDARQPSTTRPSSSRIAATRPSTSQQYDYSSDSDPEYFRREQTPPSAPDYSPPDRRKSGGFQRRTTSLPTAQPTRPKRTSVPISSKYRLSSMAAPPENRSDMALAYLKYPKG